MKWYILKPDHTFEETDDSFAAAKRFNKVDRRVGETHINDVTVSTVFLGMDHRYGSDGPPVLFETMVFGGELDQEQEHYCTWDEAVAGHEAMCTLVKASQGTIGTLGERVLARARLIAAE